MAAILSFNVRFHETRFSYTQLLRKGKSDKLTGKQNNTIIYLLKSNNN